MLTWSLPFRRSALVVGFLALFTVACGAAATPTTVPTPVPTPTDVPIESSLPDTNGVSVRDYLKEVDYQEGWELWPGKGKLYQGVDPHGMLLTTYLNSTAMTAVTDKAGVMPEGAIIVKENYMPDGVLDATTVMYKVTGFNAEHNDWFFTKLGADGSVQAEGQVPGCQACHSVKKDNDYLYTGPLK